jgi:hypothetical protein
LAKTLEQMVIDYTAKQKEDKAKGSWQWFLTQAKKLRTAAATIKPTTTPTLIKNEPHKLTKFPTVTQGQGTLIGKMILCVYDPKTKKKLPYYDLYPIGFPLEIYPDGYLMLNLHYLPPALRAKLMDNLYSFMANKAQGITEKSRLLLSYKLLKSVGRSGLYKPCVKRYLFKHVRSPWATINPTEWDLACMLPLQKFVKATETTVWQDSVKMANRSTGKTH